MARCLTPLSRNCAILVRQSVERPVWALLFLSLNLRPKLRGGIKERRNRCQVGTHPRLTNSFWLQVRFWPNLPVRIRAMAEHRPGGERQVTAQTQNFSQALYNQPPNEKKRPAPAIPPKVPERQLSGGTEHSGSNFRPASRFKNIFSLRYLLRYQTDYIHPLCTRSCA
jgi:hypothetical protein